MDIKNDGNLIIAYIIQKQIFHQKILILNQIKLNIIKKKILLIFKKM